MGPGDLHPALRGAAAHLGAGGGPGGPSAGDADRRRALRGGQPAVCGGGVRRRADCRAGAAGPRRFDDPADHTGAAERQLPRTRARHRLRRLGLDDRRHGCRGPAAGRVADRKRQLALGLRHQPSGGGAGGCRAPAVRGGVLGVLGRPGPAARRRRRGAVDPGLRCAGVRPDRGPQLRLVEADGRRALQRGRPLPRALGVPGRRAGACRVRAPGTEPHCRRQGRDPGSVPVPDPLLRQRQRHGADRQLRGVRADPVAAAVVPERPGILRVRSRAGPVAARRRLLPGLRCGGRPVAAVQPHLCGADRAQPGSAGHCRAGAADPA